ncbi:MAG: hypothetical protein N2260_03970 [Syntrophobacterales bacterium]|nr:hypothetical protein [Syntrophobacterales bacterium]
MKMSDKGPWSFFEALEESIRNWEREGVPPRWTLIEQLKKLSDLRKSLGISSVLSSPFRFITATLDDGWGLGLEIIHRACDVLGIDYTFLGLLKSPEEIAKACSNEMPDAVGVTVIQEETLDKLLYLRRLLPDRIEIFAGGSGLKEFIAPREIVVVNSVLDFILLVKNRK